MVNWDLLKKLIQTLKEEDITGLSVEEEGVKYEVQRNAGSVVSHHTPVVSENDQAKPDQAKQEDVEEDKNLIAITSPMVGTFYRSPSPGSPPFIKEGDDVSSSKVVCIIEAMKLFNEIEAETSGKVAKILVEDGQAVEYGQKLILIKKA